MGIARVYLDVNMSLSFDGLGKILSEDGVNLSSQSPDKFFLFINAKRTSFKMIFNGQFLVYHKNGSRPFPLEAIQYFPQFFDGKSIDLKGAVRKTLVQQLKMGGDLSKN